MKTKIEWTSDSWNTLRGCSRISEGCRNCYAEGIAKRFSGPGLPYESLIAKGGQWNGKIKFVEDKLTEPLKWKKPRRVFVNSMSDLFHESVPDDWIDSIFAVMALCPQHVFQILTKRPERMRSYCKTLGRHRERDRVSIAARKINDKKGFFYTAGDIGWHLPNVWLGVSVENQETADERIPFLLETPAAVRFISAEPLLGPINLKDIKTQNPTEIMLSLAGLTWAVTETGTRVSNTHPRIDWVIAGGESGPNARPMHPGWARSLRDQCVDAGTPFFFKQCGEWVSVSEVEGEGKHFYFPDGATVRRVGKKRAGRLLDGRTWDEYPEIKKS